MTTEHQPKSAGESSAVALYQLIGAPLLALIQAESQSAQATAEFIERVGFNGRGPSPGQAVSAGAGEPSEADHFGDLRMAQFQYQKEEPDGSIRRARVQVPVLSLVPIPALQIKDAELEYYIKILDTQIQTAATRVTGAGAVPGAAAEEENFLGHQRLEFRATMGRQPGNAERRSSIETQIRLKVKVEQADIPIGLMRLFNILDETISVVEEPVGPTTAIDYDEG